MVSRCRTPHLTPTFSRPRKKPTGLYAWRWVMKHAEKRAGSAFAVLDWLCRG